MIIHVPRETVLSRNSENNQSVMAAFSRLNYLTALRGNAPW